MFDYPVTLTPDDNDTVMLRFDDLPGSTFGDDEADALANGIDLLETIIMAMITDRKDIPAPSCAAGRKIVSPSLLGSLKATVYQAMRAKAWRKADLARAMGLSPTQIDRLLDLRHASTVAQLAQALAVCGQRADVRMLEDA